MNHYRKRAVALAVAVALALCASEALAAAPPSSLSGSQLNNAPVPPPGRLNIWTPVSTALDGDRTRLAIPQTWANVVTLCTPAAFAAAAPSVKMESCADAGPVPSRDLLSASPLVSASAPDGDITFSPTWTDAVVLPIPAASAAASSPAKPDLRPDNPPIPPPVRVNVWAPVSASAPGGSGTWSHTSATWTDNYGDAPASMSPQPGFAHFQGTPGTVAVDNSAGDVSATGMEFAIDGYVLTGDALTLVPGLNNVATIYVDDDASSGTAYKAIINNTLVGNANVSLMGPGTLVLTGDNTYSGFTNIAFGTLQLGNGGTSGSIVGNVMDSTSLVFDRSDAMTYDGVISRSGNVTQAGKGTLTLTGTNTYTGETTINSGGTLALTGTGSVAASSGVIVDGTFDISGATAGSTIQSLSGSGVVALGGQPLTLSNASGEFSGVISGSGGLTLAGGIEALFGTNTYSGGTNIYGGVLQVSSDANLGDVDGKVLIDNGTLRAGASFTLGHTITVENAATIDTNGHVLTADGIFGPIVGANPGQGTLVKEGAGTLTITNRGSLDYGPTIINAGTLVAPAVALPGPLTVASGAIFDISGLPGVVVNASVPSLGGDGTVALGDNVLDITSGSASWTFGGVLADGGIAGGSGGGVNFYGSNTTATLTGVNMYTGTTTIENGTLALVGNGSIADSKLIVVGDAGNNGTLDISGTTNGATIKSLSGGVTGSGAVVLGGKTLTVSDGGGFGGVISGTGDMVLAGGTFGLVGANTYTGLTTISVGATLQLGDGGGAYATGGSIVGDVVDNGALEFDRSDDVTYAGIISGTGSVTKAGIGTLTLTGINTYTGGTTVNGWLRATHPLPGDVTVSGTLDSVPRVNGNLSNSGDVAVSGGDTTVGGDYTQIVGGVDHGGLDVSLGSKLVVIGTATLNGGVLRVTGADSGYVANTHTDVLTATGGVIGTFGQLIKYPGVVFTSSTIYYGANEVWLDTAGLNITVAAAAMGMADAPSMAAAQRVQSGFESINATMASGGNPAPDVLEGAGAIQHSATPVVAQETLKSLSGQLHAASAAMLFDGIDAGGEALSEHFNDLVSGRAKSGVWYGDLGWQGNLQRGGYAGATFRNNGGMAGADVRIGAHGLLGVAAGQSRGFGQLDASWDHNRTWMNNFAMYGGLVNGPWYASARVASGWYREDMQRLLQLGALGAPVGTGSSGRYLAGALEGGHLFRFGATHIVPFAAVRYQRLELGGFTEQGGMGFGLTANAHTAGRLQAGLGLRAARGWRLANGMQLDFDGSAGWRHTLHQYGDVFDASFTGFNEWLPVDGIGLSRNTAILRAGLSLWPTEKFGLRLGYMREQDQQQRASSAMLQGAVKF